MMPRIAMALIAAAFAAAAPRAQAAMLEISSGAYAQTTVRDCSLSPVGDCVEGNGASFANTVVEFALDRQPGGPSAAIAATSSLATTALGTSGGSVEVFASGSQTPLARQGGFANGAKTRVSGVTDSVSGYALAPGAAGQPVHVGLALGYTGSNVVGDLNSTGAAPVSYLSADLIVFSLETSTFVVDTGTSPPSGECVFGITVANFLQYVSTCLSGRRADYHEESTLSITSTPGTDGVAASISGTLDFTPVDGRFYFIELVTGAWGKYDSYMNSLNTIETQFVDATGAPIDLATAGFAPLPLGATEVPEPASLALLALGLAGVAGLGAPRRRKAP